MILTSFIVDTGAGLNLKCYARGLSTRVINDLAMMSANGPISTNKVTTVKFRNIENQDCVVLDNCPNVLSVGQLVSQGYDFLWLADPAKKSQENRGSTEGTSFDAKSLLENNDFEECYLITPYGHKIHLSIANRVPYYSDSSVKPADDDTSDLVSEPDFELAVSDPSDDDVDVAPAVATRITKKSKIDLTDHQQTLLDHAVSRQILKNIDTHDILHMYSPSGLCPMSGGKTEASLYAPCPIVLINLFGKQISIT